MSPKFRTTFDKFDSSSNTGSGFSVEYSASYDDSGTLVLTAVGKIDIYADIQSYKDSVDINNILLRYSRGDLDVINKVQGFYDDASNMPKTYQDVLNSVIKSQQFFDGLPVEDKSKFNNSFSEFMVALGDPDFMDKYFPVDKVSPPDDKVSPPDDMDKSDAEG